MAYAQKRGKYWTVYVKLATGRYRPYSKHPGTGQRWATKKAAVDWGREEESRINAGTWVDPRKGETTWDAWWEQWIAALDVDENTADTYANLYRAHVGPRYGQSAIGKANAAEVDAWLKALRAGTIETGPPGRRRTRAYSPRTAQAIRTLMKTMLADAAEAALIARNPLEIRRSASRGRRVDRAQPHVRPKFGATPEQVLAAAVNMHQIVGPGSLAGMGAFLRVLTAGWMGVRPGESAALDRRDFWPATRSSAPVLNVDDREGNWEERTGQAPRLKNPKGGRGRALVAPLGLAALLAAWLEFRGQGEAILFPNHQGERWRRRRWGELWNEAARGGVLELEAPSAHAAAGTYVLERAVPGLEFKGLRRVHNTWLTEIGCPDVVRAHRLGHAMDDEMQAAYSLVSPTLEAQMLTGLQELWVEAFRGYAGIAALLVIAQFAPEHAAASRSALSSAARPAIGPSLPES